MSLVVSYPPPVSETETWVINSGLTSDVIATMGFDNFTCDGIHYKDATAQDSQVTTYKDEIAVMATPSAAYNVYYTKDDNTRIEVITNNFWNKDIYRTVTFDSPITDSNLTWFQVNAVKQ